MSLLDTPSTDPAPAVSPAAALAFLWSGRWLIAFVTVLAGGLGVAYAEHRGTVWQARSVVYVERNPAAALGGNQVPARNYPNNQAAMMQSLPILQAAIDRPGIASNPVFDEVEEPIAWLKRHLSVRVGELDGLITVSLDSPLLDEACALVNVVVDAYLGFHAKAKTETASEILGHLTAELTRRENEVNTVQTEQMEFLRSHPGIGLNNETSTVATERLRELNAALTRAESEMVEADANRGSAARVQEPASVTTLRQRRLELLAEVTPEHPAIVQLGEVIADLEQRRAGSLAQAYLSAKQRYEDLAAKVREQESKILAEYPTQAEYRIIQLRVERARNIADALSERVRDISINAMELNAVIYERATPAGALVASSKAATVAVLMFVGLFLGTGLAWIRSLMAKHVKSVGDAAALVHLSVAVPRFRPDRRSVLNSWRKAPHFAEAMRSVHTVLCLAGGRGGNQILQVTSTPGRHGKSLVAAGLGIAMAQSGQRTLIIDPGFRQATQAGLFGVPPGHGLAQVLAGTAVLTSAIAETGVAGLHLLRPGSLPAGAPALLDSARFNSLLHELRSHYARVVIDSPALSPNADGRILAARCDAVLLVLRSGKSTKAQVRDALDVIAAVGGRVAGAVLNRAPRGTGSTVGRGRDAGVNQPNASAVRARADGDRRAAKDRTAPPATLEKPEAFG